LLAGAGLLSLIIMLVLFVSTPPGTRFVVRRVLGAVNGQLMGTVTVEHIGGSVLRHLILENVSVRDRNGDPIATAGRVEVQYNPLSFLGGRYVVGPVAVDSPAVWVTRRTPNAPLNVATLTPASDEPAQPSASLIALEDVTVTGGAVEVRIPTEPPVGSYVARNSDTYVVREVDARLPRVQLAAPGRVRSLEVVFEQFSARVIEPHDVPVGLNGAVEMIDDSLAVDVTSFNVGHATATVGGWARMDAQPIEFSGRIDARGVDTDVVRRFVSSLPEELAGLSGEARVQVRSLASGGFHVVGDTISVRSTSGETLAGRVEGEFVDRDRWDVETAQMEWANLNIERFQAFLDTLPLRGTIAGDLAVRGTPDALTLSINASVRDDRGRTPASIEAEGGMAVASDSIVFREMAVRRARVELSAVRAFAPDMQVPGVVTGTATLDGPPRDLRIRGVVRHAGPDLPSSSIRGTARITFSPSRPIFFDTDLTLDSIFPAALLGNRWDPGAIRGDLSARGVMDSLDIAADLTNAAGRLDATGTVVARGDGTVNVDGRVANVDASALHAAAPPTDLSGTITGVVRSWRGERPVGEATLRFDSSTVAGTQFRSAYLSVAATNDVLRLDSLWMRAPAFTASGAGHIGRDDRTSGTLTVDVEADSLQHFARLADWLAGADTLAVPTDSTEATPLSGRATAHLEMTGSLEQFDALGHLTVENLLREGIASRSIVAEFAWTSGDSTVMLAASADSLSLSNFLIDTTDVRVDGALGSMNWAVMARHDTTSIVSGGYASIADSLIEIRTDSLAIGLATSEWRATSPLRVLVRGRTVDTDSVVIARVGRTGRITLAGHYAPDDSVRVLAVVDSFPVGDLVALLPDPPTGVGGYLVADLNARGSPSAPAIDMQFEVVGPMIENVAIPSVTGSAAYADRVLNGDLTLVRAGTPIMQANAQFPVDLSLPGPRERRLDGPVTITGQIDSIRLDVLDALLPNLEETDGSVTGSVNVSGNWFDPQMRGSVRLRNGVATLPALGISLSGAEAELQLVRDTIHIGRLHAASGPGTVDVSGSVWLQELSRPILGLAVQANRFQAMNDPEFLSLVASGDLELRGPVFGATLSGTLQTPNAALYFDRFIDNQLVDLSDSLYASFVDTTVLAEGDLGPSFQNLFVDSLRIENLNVTMGSDVWLRSEDVNVQLTGSLQVSKTGSDYRATGVLSAVRGTYVLRLGPAISREFRVQRGEVRYLGTPDMNATLDIDAEHTVRTFRGEGVRVQAHIGGTIQNPEVTLSSDLATNVSDTEIISYLLFGAPSVQAFAGQGGRNDRSAFQQGAERVVDALAGGLETGLTSGLGIPLDYLRITPGRFESGLSGTEIMVGKQLDILGRASFLTASPRVCPQDQLKQIGASIETWLTNHWLIVASIDPLKGCEAPASGTTAYQLGADVFWETR
jgi:translocation and assembly module TamB